MQVGTNSQQAGESGLLDPEMLGKTVYQNAEEFKSTYLESIFVLHNVSLLKKTDDISLKLLYAILPCGKF
jgi:hypothetical protein